MSNIFSEISATLYTTRKQLCQKGAGVLTDTTLNMSQQNGVVAKKDKVFPGCVR